MIKTINILGYRINFVFRHKFEKPMDAIDKYSTWKEYRLGVWIKPYKAVGEPKNGRVILGKNTTLNRGYMFGVDLIICKFWINICYRPLTFGHEE